MTNHQRCAETLFLSTKAKKNHKKEGREHHWGVGEISTGVFEVVVTFNSFICYLLSNRFASGSASVNDFKAIQDQRLAQIDYHLDCF